MVAELQEISSPLLVWVARLCKKQNYVQASPAKNGIDYAALLVGLVTV